MLNIYSYIGIRMYASSYSLFDALTPCVNLVHTFCSPQIRLKKTGVRKACVSLFMQRDFVGVLVSSETASLRSVRSRTANGLLVRFAPTAGCDSHGLTRYCLQWSRQRNERLAHFAKLVSLQAILSHCLVATSSLQPGSWYEATT